MLRARGSREDWAADTDTAQATIQGDTLVAVLRPQAGVGMARLPSDLPCPGPLHRST